MSAFETLSNDHNLRLRLYSDGTKLKSKIEDLCSLLEHLIDHQIDITGPCGIKLSNKPRGDLEGWEFEDVAGMDQDPLHPRAAAIELYGKGWFDFTRAIQAVTLFGCDFGNIIQPDVETCSRWTRLPTGRYYITACVSDLDRVFKERGFLSDGHIRLSDNLIWHTPSESESHVSSFSSPGIRSTELPSDVHNNPSPLHMLEPAYQTYPKNLYTVGILCALPKELKAVWALFDKTHNTPENVRDDRYVFGSMEHHMVVATCLSRYGTNEAAYAASTMKHTFNLRFCLLVGIGGGVPSRDNDIRLGDVVVGEEVVQHDLGKREKGGFERKEQTLRCPPDFLMDAISTQIKANPNPQSGLLMRHLDTISCNPEMSELYCHQGEEQDILFQSCSDCPSLQEPCPHNGQHVLSQRDPRVSLEPKVHYGRIASGNQVIKDAGFRDEQAKKLNAICFEMEAAGVVNVLPCLVIRGISDYCDGQKNDVWQEYAAATAAAYAKLLLTVVKKRDTDDDSRHH